MNDKEFRENLVELYKIAVKYKQIAIAFDILLAIRAVKE